MPRVGDVFQLLSGTLAVPNTTIQSAPYNAQQNDWVTEANSPRPISAGGTGETTAEGARTELGAIGVGDLANADTKAAVVDTDSVVIIDSQDANTNKRWLVSDLETRILTLNPPTAQARNRLVNGAMQISQEVGGGNPSTVSGAYPVDQWKIAKSAAMTGVITCTQRFTPSESPYWLQLQTTTDQPTIANNSVWYLYQVIEGNRTSDFLWGKVAGDDSHSIGSPAVLRLRVRAGRIGTYGFFIRNNPATHTYVGTFTINDEILGPDGPIAPSEVGRLVDKIIPIPAPPVGSTWAIDDTAGITVGLTMAAGANNLSATSGWKVSSSVYGVTGQDNFMGVLNNEISISAVALYLDPDNTRAAPKWEMPDDAEELRACQRYYQKLGSLAMNGYHASASSTIASMISLPIVMRAVPTISVLIVGVLSNATPVNDGASVSAFRFGATTTAAGSTSIFGRHLAFNARL